MYAFKAGTTVLDESTMNSLLSLQPFKLIYEGTQRAGKTGSGVVENSIANYSYCARFTLTGSTEIGRIELELDRDNQGADLIVQVRSGMTPTSGADGTLLKQVVVPKEFIPDPKGYWSIPIGLTGLTSGGTYWLVVIKAGDSTNKVDWIGETAQDTNYPAYQRAGDSGAWVVRNALHFRVLSGDYDRIIHTIYTGTAFTTITYDALGRVARNYRYLPPADGPEGGIRDALKFIYDTDTGMLKGVENL